jgi:hypothetical protein
LVQSSNDEKPSLMLVAELREPVAFGAGVLVDGAGVAVDLGGGEDGEGGVGGGAVEAGGFEDGFEFAGADDGVDFGDVGADLVAVALDEAAGDDEALGAAAVGDLVLHHLEDGVDGLLLGGVDEGAGVDDEDVGVFGAGVSCAPPRWSRPIMTSESTRFLGQPSETKPTVGGGWVLEIGSRGRRRLREWRTGSHGA